MTSSINSLPLPTEPFNVVVLQDKMNNGLLKNHLDAIEYISQFYFENVNGGTYYKYNPITCEFDFKEKKDFTNEVLNKVDNNKDIVQFFKTNSKIYNIVSEVLKPRHYSIGNYYYINLCQGLLHKNIKPYDEYEPEIKEKINLFLSMMKEVSCSNDEILFNAYIKWYAQVVRGIQTQVIIYKKSPEGTGKSTETDFIMEYVIGESVSCLPNTECLTTNFNKCLMGKILVIFEELPTFSSNQWAGVSTKLKGYATNPTLQFRDLFEKSVVAKNVFNAIINTNVEAIKNSEQRRIVIMPINPSRMKDYKYFEYIRKNIYNLEIGEAFYSYLLSIDVSQYNAQRDFPLTDEKKNVISQLLPSPYKFLKSQLLDKVEIGRIKPKDLYNQYLSYCEQDSKIKPVQFYQFIEKLKEIQIVSQKSGTMYYQITIEQLQSIATKFNWLSDYDCEGEEEDIKELDTVEISKDEYEQFTKWKEEQTKVHEPVVEPVVQPVKIRKVFKIKHVVQPVVEPVVLPVVEPVVQPEKKVRKVFKKKPVSEPTSPVSPVVEPVKVDDGDMILELFA